MAQLLTSASARFNLGISRYFILQPNTTLIVQHKYCIRFKIDGIDRSGYFRGHCANQALVRCLTQYKYKAITYLEIEGDPLPVAKDFAAKQIIKKLTSKQIALKKKQGALKYQRLHGKLPY